MSKENKARGGSRSPRRHSLCALICGGVIGWPSVDAAYFAELACAGLPIFPPPQSTTKFLQSISWVIPFLFNVFSIGAVFFVNVYYLEI